MMKKMKFLCVILVVVLTACSLTACAGTEETNYTEELPISATMLRRLMVFDQRKEWMKYVNPKLHKRYDDLRRELMSVLFYQNMLAGGQNDGKEDTP